MTTLIILSIGDELVLGQTVDTNSAWLSTHVAAVGVRIVAHATVADDQAAIERAIELAAPHCDILLISGGLGPTEDDLTRQALAGVLKQPLEMNAAALATLTGFFNRLSRPMPEANKIQAMVPRGAALIDNTCGTAPGIDATYTTGEHACRIFVMPGVPKEMKVMFTRDILPHLQAGGGGAAIRSRTLHTFGPGESHLAEKLGGLMTRGRNPSVGTTVSGGIVSLRVNAYFPSADAAQAELEATARQCHQALGDLIFGQDDQTLQSAVAQMLMASPAKPTVATAESCTAGLLAKMLTDEAGASAFFKQGWITYTNEAKTAMLGVPQETLAEFGAVSEPTALAMARGALVKSGASCALAITGIAGPDGGTPQKPVGTVVIALATTDASSLDGVKTFARTFIFSSDREFIRDRSAKMALTTLRFHLLGKPLPF